MEKLDIHYFPKIIENSSLKINNCCNQIEWHPQTIVTVFVSVRTMSFANFVCLTNSSRAESPLQFALFHSYQLHWTDGLHNTVEFPVAHDTIPSICVIQRDHRTFRYIYFVSFQFVWQKSAHLKFQRATFKIQCILLHVVKIKASHWCFKALFGTTATPIRSVKRRNLLLYCVCKPNNNSQWNSYGIETVFLTLRRWCVNDMGKRENEKKSEYGCFKHTHTYTQRQHSRTLSEVNSMNWRSSKVLCFFRLHRLFFFILFLFLFFHYFALYIVRSVLLFWIFSCIFFSSLAS